MKKALSSFVIISNSLNNGQDSITAFIPFMVRLFDLKNYASVDVETICKDFIEEYGIQIPRHPTETILNRMKPKYLLKEHGKIFIKKDEIQKSTQKIDLEKETRKYNSLLEDFIKFCQDFQKPIVVSRDEADILFTSFLKDHDLDIIFAAYLEENISIIPDGDEVKDPDKIYLLNKYVNSLLQKGGEYAEYLVDSAIGHKYASLILYREFSNIRGKGACANYYLDVGILFDLTGINRVFRKRAAEDFLSMLRAKGSSLWIFAHSYEEFLRIIEGCLKWIENDYYDPAKASRALQHFKDEGYGIAEIQLFISQISDVLEKNQIKTQPRLNPNIDEEYQIGREELQNIILGIYNSNGRTFEVDDKDDTLEMDLKSIENIYKLRRGRIPINLNETTHVLITSNPGLAYASTKFEQIEKKRDYFSIPTVLTDTFVGTAIWVQEPTMLAKEFNRSKLISYTNAVLQPRAMVMNRFAQEVERAKNNELNPISEESANLLLTAGLARTLLADKILGDSNRITAQTPYEIMTDLKKALVADAQEKANAAIRDSETDRMGRKVAEEELDVQTQHITRIVNTTALWGKRGVIFSLTILTIIFYSISELQEPKTLLVKWGGIALAVIFALSGISILIAGEKTENWIRHNLRKVLLPSEKK